LQRDRLPRLERIVLIAGRKDGYRTDVASSTLHPHRRSHEHHLVDDVTHAVADEFHHLKEIEEKGDSPLTALLVLGQVMLALLVVVSVEMTIAMAFYFGWL
jgi:hypothetical protein